MPKISTTITTAGASYPMMTAPVALFQRVTGLGHNAAYGLFAAGEVVTVVSGGYRLVLLLTWHDYLERQRLGLELDPAERVVRIAAYKKSLGIARGAKAAARARAGRGRGMPDLPTPKPCKTASAPKSLFPQQQLQGRSGSSESKPPAILKDSVTIT
jgi:hypothetical protein